MMELANIIDWICYFHPELCEEDPLAAGLMRMRPNAWLTERLSPWAERETLPPLPEWATLIEEMRQHDLGALASDLMLNLPRIVELDNAQRLADAYEYQATLLEEQGNSGQAEAARQRANAARETLRAEGLLAQTRPSGTLDASGTVDDQ